MATFFESSKDFSLHIEDLVRQSNCTYLETIVAFVEENGYDMEDVPPLLSPALLQKIYDEASKTYSMPKQTAVSLDCDD